VTNSNDFPDWLVNRPKEYRMKVSAIDTEIQKIDTEIATLEAVRKRLAAVRDNSGSTEDAPKVKRTRKRRIGLSAVTPPASEANLLNKL